MKKNKLNTFIILSPGIWDMGGSQMYTRNKLKFMRECSYKVNLFHSGIKNGSIFIQDLIKYKSNLISQLNYPAYIFSKKTQGKILSKLINDFEFSNNIIIESHSIATATWGELLATKVKAKHIIFLLSEKNSIRNLQMFDFLKFKLKRKELAGILEPSLPQLFNGWCEINDNEKYFLNAVCSNVCEDIPYSHLNDIPKSDFIIGSIGRLNKLFLISVINELINYFTKNSNYTFTVLLIGGEAIGSNVLDNIKFKLRDLPNVKLFVTGFIFPIPNELVLFSDVFISTSSGCLVSNSLNIPTIPIDYFDHKPIGVYGYTTKNIVYRDKEPLVDLNKLMDDILFEKKFTKTHKTNLANFQVRYDDFNKFVINSHSEIKFFSFDKFILSKIDFFELILLKILGDSSYRKISMKFWPIWKNLRLNMLKKTNN